MASEEMSFEYVDEGRTMTTDERRMPAYIISSPMSFRLRWAKNKNQALIIPFFIIEMLQIWKML